ncbi:IS110 family transposase, partial [Vogesella sp. LYT5W]
MNVSRIGVDLAKTVFQLHGVDRQEHVTLRRQLRRQQMLDFFRKLPPCLVGMEACSSAHYWARELGKLGHTVKLMAPQFVKPYVKSNKNDANDAAAICEAVSRPSMRFVPIKSTEQQDLQAVHRIRSGLIRQRTAKGNQIRGLLAEYGIVVPQRLEALRRALALLLDTTGSNGLSERLCRLLRGEWRDLQELDRRVAELDREIQRIA